MQRLSDNLSDERVAALGLWCLPSLGRDRIEKLREQHGSLTGAIASNAEARGLGERMFAEAQAFGASVLLAGDPEWPLQFDRTQRPPGALFVWGQLPPEPRVAIVGSRHATPNGLAFAEQLAQDLCRDGLAVVSGGALGIDAAAHRGALAAGGKTVAVLGAGLDHLYPSQHRGLFAEIVEKGGAVVSEFPFGTPPFQELFPRRNRLVAALSGAVVVVQAAPRSGSLSTAGHARKLGISLLAVPGAPGDAVASGVNQLLRDGALICTGADDVRRALGIPLEREGARAALAARKPDGGQGVLAEPTPLSATDRFSAMLSVAPRSVDEIAGAAGLTPAQAAAALGRLELIGKVQRAPGGAVYATAGLSPNVSREEAL